MVNHILRKYMVMVISILILEVGFLPTIGGNVEKIVVETINNKNVNAIFLNNYPEEEWNKTFGGVGLDAGTNVQQTADGGFILTGMTNQLIDDLGDAWLIKTDDEGVEEWNKTYGGIDAGHADVGLTVHLDGDNGFVVSGSTGSFGLGEADFWLFKTDRDGNEIWNKTYGGAGGDISWSSCQTMDGGYIIVGQIDTQGENEADVGVVKTDRDGNEIWFRTYGGTYYDVGHGILQTSDGGYIIVANTVEDIEKTGLLVPVVWLIKTDSDGDVLWDEKYGNQTSLVSSMSVSPCQDGGFIIVGSIVKDMENLSSDIWLLKINSNGDVQWDKSFDGMENDSGMSVFQTSDAGFVVTGSVGSDFLPQNISNIGDAFLMKTDTFGKEKWTMTFGGMGNDTGWTVKQTNDNGFIIVGYTDSYGIGDYDVWLIKTKCENHPPSTPIINGPTRGKTGAILDYDFTNCVDPDGDDMTYHVEWGDGGVDEGFVESGGAFTLSHTWTTKDDYVIRAKLIDDYGAESEWGTFQVAIPRNKMSGSNSESEIFTVGIMKPISTHNNCTNVLVFFAMTTVGIKLLGNYYFWDFSYASHRFFTFGWCSDITRP
jgi:hypothetical protein